jgi:hypothetical protein
VLWIGEIKRLFRFLFPTILLLLCLSCNTKQKETTLSETKVADIIKTDTTTISVQPKTDPDSELLKKIIHLSKQKVSKDLQYDSIRIEPVPFTDTDWEKVKRGYNQWRNKEIKKGNFIEECSEIEYTTALPRIPKKFNWDYTFESPYNYVDTLMADINFDGKPDVIFRIYPESCAQTSYSIANTMFLAFLSKNDKYEIDKYNMFIHKAVHTIEKIKIGKPTDRSYFMLDTRYYSPIDDVVNSSLILESISVKDGIVIISGHFWTDEFLHEPSFGSCCPNFCFDCNFTFYVDQKGKGYAEIKGTYTSRTLVEDEQEEIKERDFGIILRGA